MLRLNIPGQGSYMLPVRFAHIKRTAADANTAAATAAYALSDACFVYPITPSTPMAQNVEVRGSRGDKNAYGRPVLVRQMQSEAGVAGALHGALQSGLLSTSFTSSQGLLLMVPTLYKIAGEGLPLVLHVAARAVSANGVTIHSDHSDVYSLQGTGVALLSSHSVQEAADLAVAAHIAAVRSSSPFVHFFEGMQLSHEIADCVLPTEDQLKSLAPYNAVAAFRSRCLTPEKPACIGTVLGRDTFWQQAASDAPRYASIADHVDKALSDVSRATGRKKHGLFEYVGSPRAERVVVAMGAHAQTVELAVRRLIAKGERVGVIKVHLFRPWSAKHFLSVLPRSRNLKRIAVLDRAHDPTASGDPLFLDVVASLNAAHVDVDAVLGGSYAVGDHDFSVAMAETVFDELKHSRPRQRFTVGLVDDVSNTALPFPKLVSKNNSTKKSDDEPYKCVFWGIGGDGTVSANKNVATLICDHRVDMSVRAAFHYDAHKTGGVTLSHLQLQKRKEPVSSTEETVMFHGGIGEHEADFVACHVPQYLSQYDVLAHLKPGGTILVNTPAASVTIEDIEKVLPATFRAELARLNAKLFVIDASRLAKEAKLGQRTNTVLSAAFLKVANCVGTPEDCAKWLKALSAKSYGKANSADTELLEKNNKAIDLGFSNVKEVKYPKDRWLSCAKKQKKEVQTMPKTPCGISKEYVKDIADPLKKLEGMNIPVSALLKHSKHGLTPCGTSVLEKRGIAENVPKWSPDKCIQCNRCSFFCPHSAIRPFLIKSPSADGSVLPAELPQTIPCEGGDKNMRFRIQVSPLDCAACGACVRACPVGALEMKPASEMKIEAKNWETLQNMPRVETPGEEKPEAKKPQTTEKKQVSKAKVLELRPRVPNPLNVRTSQFSRPLLEFAGACAGCPEPVYTKLLTQLYGDRLMLANGIGCSTVWSGTAFCSPVSRGIDGRGPSWGCSLFENNAEYGYGMALGSLVRRQGVRNVLLRVAESKSISQDTKIDLMACLATWDDADEEARLHISNAIAVVGKELKAQRTSKNPDKALIEDLETLLRDKGLMLKRSHWMVGGDGWAHDIGFGGLDHVLASKTPVRILVLDNENYANTGGQASKATSAGAVAKLASTGKATPKKDLGVYAATMYPHCYVASVCYGADPEQTLRALREAEENDGPSLVVCYCPCIEHQPSGGFNGATAIEHMKLAVKSGYWALYTKPAHGQLRRTSKTGPTKTLDAFLLSEGRFSGTMRNNPERALLLRSGLQTQIGRRDGMLQKLSEPLVNRKAGKGNKDEGK